MRWPLVIADVSDERNEPIARVLSGTVAYPSS
jgi:hypothetical protein